jgi:hypothetical protein
MNGRTAKALRKIARALELAPKSSYVPGGKLRRTAAGAPIRRPAMIVDECFRRAYLEAKRLYKGKPRCTIAPQMVPDEG